MNNMISYIFSHLAQLAGLISFSAYIIYIISIFRGKTKPSRSTWWILTLVGGLILWSSYSLGLYGSLWIQTSYVLGPLLLAILSIKYGEGTGLSVLDKICLIGAALSGLLWIIFNSPLIGFLGSIVVDFIGLIPTIRKSFLTPEEEDPNAWLIETISSVLNLFAVTAWFSLDQKDWIYALYLALVNGGLTILLWRKRIYEQFFK
jgi:hypothetical protein